MFRHDQDVRSKASNTGSRLCNCIGGSVSLSESTAPVYSPPTVLVVDPDDSFLASLKQESSSVNGNLLVCHRGQEGQQKLADKSLRISGLFISVALDPTYFSSIIRFGLQHRYGIPIYILYQTPECPISTPDLHKLGVIGSLKKPVTYKQLMETVGLVANQFNVNEVGSQTDGEGGEVGEESQEKGSFHPIRAESFISGKTSPFNLYIKLGNGKFLKILHAGESFEGDKLNDYKKKGVEHFFLGKESQVKYLDYCNQIVSRLLNVSTAPTSVKAQQVFNYGEQAIELVKSHGLKPESIAYCKDSVVKIQGLIKTLDNVQSPPLNLFMKNALAFEHGVGTAVLANLVGRESLAGINGKGDIILLSGLLHDIGLYSLPKELHHEDEGKMTPEQRAEYETHPMLGAESLSQIKLIPQPVVQAVREHHERRPKGKASAQTMRRQTNLIAETIGIADEFLRFLKSDVSKQTGLNRDALNTILSGFSIPVVEAFKRLFLKS